MELKDLYMVDFYSLLCLPMSREGHVNSVIAKAYGVDPKTIKRRKKKIVSDSENQPFDHEFWKKNGFLCESDWNFIQSPPEWMLTLDLMGIPRNASRKEIIPEFVREISPNFMPFLSFLFSLKSFAGQDQNAPPQCEAAINFLLNYYRYFSKVYFNLINKNKDEYLKCISEWRQPINFPAESIWDDYMETGTLEKSENLKIFFYEHLLICALCFDIVLITGVLGNDDSLGKSALLYGLRDIANGKLEKNRRKHLLEYLKSKVAEKHCGHTSISDQQFFCILANNNENSVEAIKKQYSRLSKNQFPTPKDLDDFLTKCVTSFGINDDDQQAIDKFYWRTQFANCILIELIVTEYVDKNGFYESYQALFERLVFFRNWLCAEVFRCPVPS